MTANKLIILSVTLYIIIMVIMYMVYSNHKFTGGDAAGTGMAKGLTFYYGLGVLFLIAIVLTIVNGFFFKGITHTWVKVLFFMPILLPLIIFAFEYFEIGKFKSATVSEQFYKLKIEFRTSVKIDNTRLSFKSPSGGYSGKLKYKKTEDDFHYYEISNAIRPESNRRFHLRSQKFGTIEFKLDIPFEPDIIPFSDWKMLAEKKEEGRDTLQLEFRYNISK